MATTKPMTVPAVKNVVSTAGAADSRSGPDRRSSCRRRRQTGPSPGSRRRGHGRVEEMDTGMAAPLGPVQDAGEQHREGQGPVTVQTVWRSETCRGREAPELARMAAHDGRVSDGAEVPERAARGWTTMGEECVWVISAMHSLYFHLAGLVLRERVWGQGPGFMFHLRDSTPCLCLLSIGLRLGRRWRTKGGCGCTRDSQNSLEYVP